MEAAGGEGAALCRRRGKDPRRSLREREEGGDGSEVNGSRR
jgi:hypothetical protein